MRQKPRIKIMAEINTGQLDGDRQEFLMEAVSDRLAGEGYEDRQAEEGFGDRVYELPADMQKLIHDAYLMGFNDGVVRVRYGMGTNYEIKNTMARILRQEIESLFGQHERRENERSAIGSGLKRLVKDTDQPVKIDQEGTVY